MVSPFFLAKAKLSVAKLSVVIPLLSIVPVMLQVFSVIPVDRVNAVDSVFPVDPGCICFFMDCCRLLRFLSVLPSFYG
jgi:hypothetical protein